MKKIFLYSALGTIIFTSACKPIIQQTTITKGSADFTKYVAIGNSLCAGYTDGGLSKEAQENSFPRMLAQQFALAGGGSFNTPWMENIGGGNDGSDSTQYILKVVNGSPTPVRISGAATTLNDNTVISPAGPYQHLGIPGIRAIDVNLSGYGLFNKFLGRITASPSTSDLLSEALKNKATFFSYWLGSNDALLWATNGGVGSVQTASGWAFPGTLSSPSSISFYTNLALDSLTKNGAKGVVANVPDVASTPFFTTIPNTAVVFTRQGQVDSLNIAYLSFNSVVPDTSKIIWKLGANAIVIADAQAPGGIRKTTSSDLICLTAMSVLPTGAGSAAPLDSKYVLDRDELAIVRNYTNQYNANIKSLAESKGLAYVDINTFMKSFGNGLLYNGVNIGPKFVEGGGFSLDGVHPTPRGYALIANEFLKAINAKYGSNIPMVDVNKYRAVPLP